MKTTLFVIAFFPPIIHAQMYERTGKNIGLYVSGSTLIGYGKTDMALNPNMNNLSVGFMHMLCPGIYPKLGYGNSILSDLNRGLSTPYKAHCIETSMLLDKRLFKMVNGRFVRNACHYVSVGLIGAPEFRLQFSKNREAFNRLEASGMLGLSFTHITKNRGRSSMARSQQLDFFIRQGFTPIATLQVGNQSVDFRRFEVGAQLRFVFHQVNSFLPQRSRRR